MPISFPALIAAIIIGVAGGIVGSVMVNGFLYIRGCMKVKLESIDHMVAEDREELEKIYTRFLVDGVCRCPLCKSLEKGNTNDESKTFVP